MIFLYKNVAWTITLYFLGAAIAMESPSKSKQYRNDYEYNKISDAFYKLHIEPENYDQASKICNHEGSELMVLSSQHDVVQFQKMFELYLELGEWAWIGDIGFPHEFEEMTSIDCAAIAMESPSKSKQYRNDYEYNKISDAFYKLHIEPENYDQASKICNHEGSELMVLSSQHDVVQFQKMFELYLELGEWAWIGDIGFPHEFEEMTSIDLSYEKNRLDKRSLIHPSIKNRRDAITRTGDVIAKFEINKLPFVCKVEAQDAPFNSQCDVYGKDYEYYSTTGSCYKASKIATTWNEGFLQCQAEGAHLVVVNSPMEGDAIKALTMWAPLVHCSDNPSSHLLYFVGLKAAKPVGNSPPLFKTIFEENLEEAGYVNWADREPNNAIGTEYCVAIYKERDEFNDVSCTQIFPFICEKEVHIPTTDINIISSDELAQTEQVQEILPSITENLEPNETDFFNWFPSVMEVNLKEQLINFQTSITEDLKNEFKKSFDEFKSEIAATKSTLEVVVVKLNERVASLEEDNKNLRSELSASQLDPRPKTGSASALLDIEEQLKVNQNERDQAALVNEIESTGIPEFEGESVDGQIRFDEDGINPIIVGMALEERNVVGTTRADPPRLPQEMPWLFPPTRDPSSYNWHPTR